MSDDGAIFVRRALAFLDRVAAGRPTTAAWLARDQSVSVPTARRVIERLRSEYALPLTYDQSERTWFLEHDDWSFDAAQLAPRGELIALAFSLRLGRTLIDPELRRALETLRQRIARLTGHDEVGLRRMLESFTADRTDASVLRDPIVQTILEAIGQGRVFEFDYDPPWQDEGPRRWRLRPLHVRQTDGALYMFAMHEGEREVIFNLGFAHRATLGEPAPTPRGAAAERERARVDRWSASYGIWTGEDVEHVVVYIAPPGARYYAAQQWHDAQRDHFEGEVLVRALPAHNSPELHRRLLSLGDALAWVEPEAVRVAVRRQAVAFASRLDRDERPG